MNKRIKLKVFLFICVLIQGCASVDSTLPSVEFGLVGNKFPDIAVGSSVILKTVLHHNKIDLVPEIIEKYPLDAINTLEDVIDKRKKSPSVDIVKQAILKMKLDKELSEKPNYSLIKI